MMNRKEKIEREIEKTLAQFEQPDVLPANPWFYARLRQRLEGQARPQNMFLVALKPALLTLLMAMNLVTLLWYFKSPPSNPAVTSQKELIEILADDFQLDNSQNNWFNFE